MMNLDTQKEIIRWVHEVKLLAPTRKETRLMLRALEEKQTKGWKHWNTSGQKNKERMMANKEKRSPFDIILLMEKYIRTVYLWDDFSLLQFYDWFSKAQLITADAYQLYNLLHCGMMLVEHEQVSFNQLLKFTHAK